MALGARRDLGRVGHREHLRLAREARQPLAHRVGDRAADAGVDFVEHQRRRGAALGETDLDRQQETASSPPEATFIKGPGREPGLVRTRNSARS